MKLHPLSTVLGLTSVAIVSTVAISESANAATFNLTSGVTSVFLDLPTLSSVGLNLTGAAGVVDPVSSNFLVGFPITSNTTFRFDFSDTGAITPLGGTIEHSGSVTFNNSLTVGNFSIGFDPARSSATASGFFVRDTITTGAALFDVATIDTLSFNPAVAESNFNLASNLLVSPELAGVLGNAGLAGAEVGAASINGTAVPEPMTIIGALTAGGFLAASRRRRAAKNQ
jgi:hypothetical protein